MWAWCQWLQFPLAGIYINLRGCGHLQQGNSLLYASIICLEEKELCCVPVIHSHNLIVWFSLVFFLGNWHYWKQFYKGAGPVSSPHCSVLGCQATWHWAAAASWGWGHTTATGGSSSLAGQLGSLHLPLPCHVCTHKVRGCPVSLSRERGITAGKKVSWKLQWFKAAVSALLNPGHYPWFMLTFAPLSLNASAILDRF